MGLTAREKANAIEAARKKKREEQARQTQPAAAAVAKPVAKPAAPALTPQQQAQTKAYLQNYNRNNQPFPSLFAPPPTPTLPPLKVTTTTVTPAAQPGKAKTTTKVTPGPLPPLSPEGIAPGLRPILGQPLQTLTPMPTPFLLTPTLPRKTVSPAPTSEKPRYTTAEEMTAIMQPVIRNTPPMPIVDAYDPLRDPSFVPQVQKAEGVLGATMNALNPRRPTALPLGMMSLERGLYEYNEGERLSPMTDSTRQAIASTQDQGFWGQVWSIVSNPGATAEIGARSIGSSGAVPTAATLIPHPLVRAAGAFVGSFPQERLGTLTELMQQRYPDINLSDKNAIREAIARDPEFWATAAKQANWSGGIKAFAEAASAAVAGPLSKVTTKNPLAKRMLNAVVERLIDMGIAGGGEVAGETAKGVAGGKSLPQALRDVDTANVLWEMGGELTGGSPQLAGALLQNTPISTRGTQRPTAAETTPGRMNVPPTTETRPVAPPVPANAYDRPVLDNPQRVQAMLDIARRPLAIPENASRATDTPAATTPQRVNWRDAVANESDPMRRADILQGIANVKVTAKELSDALEMVEPSSMGSKSLNIAWDIARNPRADERTRQQALALRDKLMEPTVADNATVQRVSIIGGKYAGQTVEVITRTDKTTRVKLEDGSERVLLNRYVGEGVVDQRAPVSETQAPLVKTTGNIPEWVLDLASAEGKDITRRWFNEVDLANPSVRDAIRNDPQLTPTQRDHLLKTGELPTNEPNILPPTPDLAPATPAAKVSTPEPVSSTPATEVLPTPQPKPAEGKGTKPNFREQIASLLKDSEYARTDRNGWIADYLVAVTADPKNKGLTGGKRVLKRGDKYLLQTRLGEKWLNDYAPMDAAQLRDTARRTDLGYFTKQADDYRGELLSKYSPKPADAAVQPKPTLVDRFTPEERAALERLKAPTRGATGQLPKGEGASEQVTQRVRDLTVIGRAVVREVGKDFAKWSQAVVDEVGEWAREYLPQVWDAVSGDKTPPAVRTAAVEQAGKPRKFPQTVAESDLAPKPLKEAIRQNPPTYEPISNKETLQAAQSKIDADISGGERTWRTVLTKEKMSAEDVAVGEDLIRRAITEGRIEDANQLTTELAELLTQAGQTVQAASMMKRLTPEGMLLYAQRALDRANALLPEQAKKAKLSDADAKRITELMQRRPELMGADTVEAFVRKYEALLQSGEFTPPQVRALRMILRRDLLNAPDQAAALRAFRERMDDVLTARTMQIIADAHPVTFGDRLRALQRISMLLNPKTVLSRNVSGNALKNAVSNFAETLAVPIDVSVKVFTGKRTVTAPSLLTQGAAFGKGIQRVIDDIRLGVDTSPSRTQFELPQGRVFKSNFWNGLDQIVRRGLTFGDRPFYEAAYTEGLRQYMKVNNLREATVEAKEYATRVAQIKTYVDANTISDAFEGLRRTLNGDPTGRKGTQFGFGNIVLPFTKTPANILARALDYSVGGAVRTAKAAGITGQGFNQQAFVKNLSKTLTGAGLIYAGYVLASQGLLRGAPDKSRRKEQFQRAIGKQPYSYVVGDKSYTYDWAQPASFLIAIGANIHQTGADKAGVIARIKSAIVSGGDTLFNLSVMQGLRGLVGYGSVVEGLLETAADAPLQAVPTIAGQTARSIDPTMRSTYSDRELDAVLRTVTARVPFLSRTLQPRINIRGERMRYAGGPLGQYLSPANIAKVNEGAIDKEILRLYADTGDSEVFPRAVQPKFTYDKQEYTLNPEQYTKFQQLVGTATYVGLGSLVNNPSYRGYNDETKARIIKGVIRAAYDAAREQILTSEFGVRTGTNTPPRLPRPPAPPQLPRL